MNKPINIEQEKLINTYIWSILLYGCERWTLLKNEVTRLEPMEMWLWRMIKKAG